MRTRPPEPNAATTDRRTAPMRAVEPDHTGTVSRDGVETAYEVFGADHASTVVLLPTWSIVHSRHWKAQVPVLSRRHRVVTIDGRGNGGSSRPRGAEAYHPDEFVADVIAVFDATGTERAVVAGVSFGGWLAFLLAARHQPRVTGACFIGASVPFLDSGVPPMLLADFDTERDDYEAWDMHNRHAWKRDHRQYLEFFFSQCLVEDHSTKEFEDCVGWGLDTTPEVLADTRDGQIAGITPMLGQPIDELCDAITCPTLHIHGDRDAITPHAWGVRLADKLGGRLVTVEGGGHLLQAREPVLVNDLLLSFVHGCMPPPARRTTWTRALQRPRRALYVSSPIGLGHAQRDIAIAQELRKIQPDLQIEWLAQHPVTTALAAQRETIHPASALLASESAHIESESHEHDLHAFQAIRTMDDVLVSNFSVFDELLHEEHFDLVIADEAWDLDYFLHENPERKRCSFAWMTDFVGWLPVDDDTEEIRVTADYNAEMIEHIERFRRVRDRSIFVGDPEDIVPASFGPDLPAIRDWTEEHFDFSGYVTGFDAITDDQRASLRSELGYGDGDTICIVTVGGSGVGESLLGKVIASHRYARDLLPGLRMIVVAGPRLDPARLPRSPGLEIHAYVPGLYRHLAACDVAVVQGGLTTTMELAAGGRPFVYFPLAHHFEQQHHVRHRLNRYRAGVAMDYATSSPQDIAAMIAKVSAESTDYLQVATDGAARAAALLTELL
jgi:pimeloyl-ACP methyl ester carboxylesterase/predicted glycosyltransferase